MAGPSRRSASSASAATTLVLAPSWAEITITTPGSPFTPPSPTRGAAPSATRPRSPSRSTAPSFSRTTARASAAGARSWPSVRTTMRWLGVSSTPAPRTPVAPSAAAMTSGIPIR